MINTLRLLFRRTPSLSPSPPTASWVGHACTGSVDAVPPPSPLLTELIALRAHTRHLSRLSEREHRPEQFQHLARTVLQDLLDGWRVQTDGTGQLTDLIQPPAHTPRQAPRTHGGPPMAQSQPQSAIGELT